ncbi:MAG: hypothetical protein ACRC13_05600 [Tannerellaceae bacterium]
MDKCYSRNSFTIQKAQFDKYTAAQLEEALAANDKRIAELLPHTLGDKVHFSILGQLRFIDSTGNHVAVPSGATQTTDRF